MFLSNRFVLMLGSFVVPLAFTVPADAAPMVSQGFETNTDGWFGFGGSITRVPSGTDGIPSSSGSWHAQVEIGPGTGDGAYTNYGGYGDTWPGGITQSLDIYIDPAQGTNGDGWYLDNAVSDTSGVWLEAGGVGALNTGGSWWLAADGDGGGYPGPVTGGVGTEITTAGWYTIVSDWVANADGLTVDRNTHIFASNGTLLYSDLSPQAVLLADIGGTNYSWLAANGPTELTLAIDNNSLQDPSQATVPEPASLAIWGICVLGGAAAGGVRRRRRKLA